MCSCNDQPVREQVNYIIASYSGAHPSSLQLNTNICLYIHLHYIHSMVRFAIYRNLFILLLFCFFLQFSANNRTVGSPSYRPYETHLPTSSAVYTVISCRSWFIAAVLVLCFSGVAGWLAVTGSLTCAYM